MFIVVLTAKHAKTANKKGVSLVAPMRFEEESKEKVSLPSKVGTESREGREEALVRALRVVRGS